MFDIRIMKDERAFDIAAAWEIIGQILKKPDSVIGLSTGQTTKNMHAIVADIFRLYPFDVSRVTFFNVDELTNLPLSYPGCCRTMIEEQLTHPLGIPEERFLMPATLSDDFEGECRKFEAALASGTTATSASTSPARRSGATPGSPRWIPSLRSGCAGRRAWDRTIPSAG